MASNAFGKHSGPSATPISSNPFTAFSRPPSPSPPQPFPAQPLQRFPRPTEFTSTWGHGEKDTSKGNDAQNNMRPSTVTSFAASRNSGTSLTATVTRSQQHFKGNRPTSLIYTDDLLSNSSPAITTSHPRAAVVNQSHIVPQRAQSSPFVSKSSYSREKHPINEAQRPLALPFNYHNHSGSQIARSPPAASVSNHFDEHFPPLGAAQRPALSSAWGSRPKLQSNSPNPLARENLPTVPPYGNSYDPGNGSMAHPADLLGQKRNRSPPMQSAAEVFERNIQSFQGHTKRSMTDPSDFNGQKRNRSPPMQSGNEGFGANAQSFPDYTKRPSVSPPKVNTSSNPFSSDSQSHQRSSLSVPKFDVEPAATKPTGFSIPKRTRSPPLLSADQSLQGSSYPLQDDTEREMQAKAKRLQRFKTELSETVQSSSDIADQKVSAMRSTADRGKPFAELSTVSVGDLSNDNVDYESLESSNIIIGVCPDMCPESERAERERKGDLDQYERVDGDRNQTSKSLAIKKYTRTAEREANLIRPMPILQKTIDYLLNLLDQPYNNRFLGLYNFLWDRMRAIRMDLRMQHIFNRGAITMLEQMIRLHIIAMHELCEYTKGEGFSEGFDAHLNIEQMNKTSVELFQMYDDHRKKGINVPTEKEFRGYYALLKLDKHPGYKVEPAELSLDLAKMTPEIRQTPEVRFARDVARACRTGNFIAFFRLARKATYLQACLMHAHFSKLRTQALASLHCGVQNSQGLPVAHVANWIGMEEDIESLLEYHGFVVKEFQELYIVKEGPFLNVDADYPTKCSKLVHMKKSRSIAEDILYSCLVASLPTKKATEIPLGKILNNDLKVPISAKRGSSAPVDEEMQEFKALPSPKYSNKVQPILGTTVVGQLNKDDHQMDGASRSPWGFSFPPSSQGFPTASVKTVEEPLVNVHFKKIPESDMHFGKEEMQSQLVTKATQPEISSPQTVSISTQLDRPPAASLQMRTKTQQDIMSPSQIVSRTTEHNRSPGVQISYNVESSVPMSLTGSNIEDEDTPKMLEDDEIMEKQDDEVAKAKLKLILRLWKRRSLRQRELREQRQLAANAALNSLSLGPPIRFSKDQQTTFGGGFDIDHVMRERYEKHERSCSRLNVADVIAPVLSRKNPDAKCLCWKLLICSHMNNPEEEKQQNNRHGAHLAGGPWLLPKLMPAKTDSDDDGDLIISSPGLSLWKKWICSESDLDQTCCLSVIKDTNFDNLTETVSGTNGVLFLVSEHLPWERQKSELHNLVKSLPPGSCLPLLILSSSYSEDISDPSSFIVNNLGICEIDKSRVRSYKVVFLLGNKSDGFLSDERLREGLQWLAGESTHQPSLDRVKTRDLILTHLNSSLQMHVHDIRPEHCIHAFNAALDQTKLEITRAASANAACWPCPEIDMLDEFSDEHRVADLYLPNIGWSCAARVEPLTRSLIDCKLPTFPDVSWLKRGSNMGKGIENQRQELENCLIRYLTETTNTIGFALAKNEASVMLQKCARLELHNSTYYIVPDWVMIFRRIFNWRLACFSTGTLSWAYVIEEQAGVSQGGPVLDKMELPDRLSERYHLNNPSLDEMVEVSCILVSSREDDSPQMVEGSPAITRYVSGDEFKNATDSENVAVDEMNCIQIDGGAVKNDGYSSENHSNKLAVGTQQTQKLTKLLEQCNIVQNMIDQKLSIYF